MKSSARRRRRSDAADLAAGMKVPSFDNVYAIVPNRSGPVTFHSQQRRAFNLVWALVELGVLREGAHVGVIGGGLAGITSAAAAAMRGCNVTVVESGTLPFHQQRGNHTRYIHPNILEWPRPGAESFHTELPYLNWTADYCHDVIKEIEAQWITVPNVKLMTSVVAQMVKQTKTGVRVTTSPYNQLRFDVVIACIGFGKEQKLPTLSDPAYWEDDALHQTNLPFDAKILISGTGDGALIDLMRVMIVGCEHADVWEAVAAHEPLRALGAEILKAEEDAREAEDANEAGTLL